MSNNVSSADNQQGRSKNFVNAILFKKIAFTFMVDLMLWSMVKTFATEFSDFWATRLLILTAAIITFNKV